jgi:hypothetical protein
MTAAEAHDLAQRGGRDGEQLAAAQVSCCLAFSLRNNIVCFFYANFFGYFAESGGPCSPVTGGGGTKVFFPTEFTNITVICAFIIEIYIRTTFSSAIVISVSLSVFLCFF